MPGAKPPARCIYDEKVTENNKGKVVKSSIGVLGALATIISVWWFALRPRRKQGEE